MTNKVILSRLFSYVRPHWVPFLIAVLSLVVVAITEPTAAALMEPMIDGTLIEKDPDTILFVPLAFVGLFFVRGIARILATFGMTEVATRVVMAIRLDLYSKIQMLPQSYMDTHPTGHLLSRITFDVEQLSAAASHVWLVLVRDTLSVIFLLGFMFYISWQLSLFILLAAPVIGFIINAVSKVIRKYSHQLQGNMGELTHRLEESIKGQKLIKLYQAEDQEYGKLRDVINRVRQNNRRLTVVGAANSPVVQFVIAVALSSVIYFAANLEGESAMSPGQFISFFTAMSMLFAPMRALTSVIEPFQRGMAAAETIFALIDEMPEPDQGTQTLDNFSGHVQLQDVSFGYGENQTALSHINLDIQPGETVALVGASGSGKTTLVNLLARFYEPQSGNILFDTTNIKDINLLNLRKQIAFVDQNIVLFNESIAENVAFGWAQDYDPERVRWALQQANALDFVDELEDGIHAMIGEQGSLLSGGQRQRIALARAFYKDSPLLILDEATSALDNQSERYVQQALETLCQDRTTVIIAHRLSTIEKADRILVLDQGQIIEQGSHQSLLEQQGHYYRLYQQLH